ncbi:anti-phage deoxyguanosine triphosphatase [Nitrosomonas sp.]|uniref:anti-phage deoxyguanosine triphosphatase n=1 Tax=Nitrosomonas sp. TaxID=42353 RepID=UPI001DE9255B|nr:anti-phage deoxyguanosine triphosphatase [Nitrosomonas sp.]MBX3617781.1 dGTPase [Nitrosomonas sp.]
MNIWETRQTSLNGDQSKRDNFSRDRARIIHSAFFRRLQGKTQVLGLGESDFYRTRLTHSIEVAQIASGIVQALQNDLKLADFHKLLPSTSLIEAIALAHDIGHPPFGHGGEVALNYLMRDHGGFEGNAQTLRICAKLGEYSDNNGLNLTRRTLLGLLKYPALYSEVVNYSSYKTEIAPLNVDSYKPPKCVFDCELDCLDFIFNPIQSDRTVFSQIENSNDKHAKTKFKALDTSILELADDIAYGVHDLEDAIALQLVDERIWRSKVHDLLVDSLSKYPLKEKIEEITKNLFSGCNRTRKKAISFLVNHFIRGCSLTKRGIFTNDLLDTAATMDYAVKNELDILKKFVVEHVVKTAEVQTLEYKGQQMIIRIFEAIAYNPSRLLPKKYHDEYENRDKDWRVICDYIAGTTDDYATRLYHKIFTPSSGSIFDRL